SRANPPPSSVLGQLPEANAIALVLDEDEDQELYLVTVPPSEWRMRIATGRITRVSFEPATGLVLFLRERSIWAVDLLAPHDGEPLAQPVEIELARIPKSAPVGKPSEVILCFPNPPSPFTSCSPKRPIPNDAVWVPEYLEI